MGATGADVHKGQMSAWLQKKKSGSAMVRVRQYNKRYFTIDFDSRVFFYTHAENSKKASSMIPFADLVDVKLPDQPHVDKSDTASECSKQSRVSWMRRLGSGTKLGEEEHVVMLMTKPARTMELLCSSAAEALQWFEAFKAAMADRGEDEEGAGGSPCSLGVETPSSGEGLSKDAAALAAASSGDDVAGRPAAASSSAAAAAADSSAAGEAAAAPPPVKGTFLDLSTEPEALPSAGAQPAGGVEDVAVMNMSPGKLEASQFGFDGEESEGSSAASSPPGTPRGADGDGAGADAAGADAATSQPGSRPATGRRSYADQHEGLSMKERLANLEFSDAEDDDDDPLGLGTSKAG